MTGWYKHFDDSRSTYHVKHLTDDIWSIEWYKNGKWQNQTKWSRHTMQDYLENLIPLTKLEKALK